MRSGSYFIIAMFSAFDMEVSAQISTYNADVACILFEHCTSCHHEGGIAPFSLINYDDASAAAFGLMEAVNARTMPPWPPNPDYNSLAHERLLTQDEIDILNDWVNNGTPEGSGSPPQASVYLGQETITNPDLVLTMPEYTISTTGDDVFRCFVIPTTLTEDIFITELEIIPGNKEAVHHVMLYQDETSTPLMLDNADPEPGYTSFGSTGSEASIPIAGWNPGQGKKIFPNGMGVRVPAGSNIIMQIHYPGTANGQTDQSKMNIRYTTEPIREILISSFIHHFDLNEGALTIPANEIRTFTGDYTLPNQLDITLLDVNVHMHLLGSSARAWAVMPNNQTIPFIEIENWDFHWQGFYDFRRPIRIPGGTTFYGSATYDNTDNNPDNPNDPPQIVNEGNDSGDEMMLIFFSYLNYQPGDENIVVDTATVHPEHFCEPLGVVDGNLSADEMSIYPNPANNMVRINVPTTASYSVTITDLCGRTIRSIDNADPTGIDISDLPEAAYIVSVETADRQRVTKLIVQH